MLISELQLSRGVEFVYNLTVDDSYDSKHNMLASALDPRAGHASLPEALRDAIKDNDERRLAEHSDAELHSIAQRPGGQTDEDADRGPYQAWREANANRRLSHSVMLYSTVWLRERAYVFWDGDRLKMDQTQGFGENPGHRSDYTDREHEEMMESFRERSKIWRKGGTGYWGKGDTSRVVWCGGVH